jgi:hypothetical protein
MSTRTSVSVVRLLAVIALAAVCQVPAPPQRGPQDLEDSDDSPAVRALLEAAARSEPDGYDDCLGGGLQFRWR